ncbi:MAG: AsmA family protein [Steroidobacteraceae bacterium]
MRPPLSHSVTMTRRKSKILALSMLALAALALLVTAAAIILLRATTKPRVEVFASQALGMEVGVGGRVTIGFLPRLHITLADVHVRTCGADLASAGEVDLGMEFLPLLHQEVQIEKLALKRLTISLQRNGDGKLNVERSCLTAAILPAFAVPSVVVSDGRLVYADQQTGQRVEATDCKLDDGRLLLTSGASSDVLKNLSVAAKFMCVKLQTKDFTASDLRFSVAGKGGIVDFDPVTMRLFGGHGSGNVRADFAGAEPLYRVRFSLVQFRIDEFFKSLSARKIGNGSLDFSADLSLRGKTTAALVRTMAGEASLHGVNLNLNIGDVDKEYSRFEDSQRFNLVDVGAFFFAGPLGLAVTKGYDFVRLFQGTEGTTSVRTLVSEWTIEHGVAQAKDVAMATQKNRIVLRGGLDFVTEHYDEVTVALVDATGCLEVQQKVTGSFLSPQAEPPNVVKSLSGPTRHILGQVRNLLGGKCTVFYAGSVAPPK